MKSTVNSNSILKTIAMTATAAVLFAGSPISSFANAGKEKQAKTTSISESQINVQYIGSDENAFKFRVQFENTEAKKFTLIVKNDDGDVVYSQQFSDVHFAKTLLLKKDEVDALGMHPTIGINTGKEIVQRKFSISIAKKYTEDVLVTKL
jgi:uncharacterized radical SAM superfamily protein